jgi:hypothetical protein
MEKNKGKNFKNILPDLIETRGLTTHINKG